MTPDRHFLPLHRRGLLKSLALGGITSLAFGGALPALSSTAHGRPVATRLVLVNDLNLNSPFLQGARLANPSGLRLQSITPDLIAMQAFDQLLRTEQTLPVIGLLDDASATLVLDLARSAGSRVRWLGQHSCANGITHHRLLDASNTEQHAQQLSQDSGEWMAQLGFHLASAAPTGLTMPAVVNHTKGPDTGSFVSFAIAV